MKNIDLNVIKGLAEVMRENGLTSLCVKSDEAEIKLGREASSQAAPVAAAQPVSAAAPTAAPPVIKGGTPVKSPMVGVFYSAPSPEENPYVKVGDTVKKGDVLCIVEAMKLMNEITAEQDGEIVEICAEDGGLVEFGQTLFILK